MDTTRKGWIVELDAPRRRILQCKLELSDAKKRLAVMKEMADEDPVWAPKLKEAQQWVTAGERRVTQAERELEEYMRHNAEVLGK